MKGRGNGHQRHADYCCGAIVTIGIKPSRPETGYGYVEALPAVDGEVAADESCFKEVARFRICPREGSFGIQIPRMAWHTVDVHEASTIVESKDGRYGE